jgi:hypothetical protein
MAVRDQNGGVNPRRQSEGRLRTTLVRVLPYRLCGGFFEHGGRSEDITPPSQG